MLIPLVSYGYSNIVHVNEKLRMNIQISQTFVRLEGTRKIMYYENGLNYKKLFSVASASSINVSSLGYAWRTKEIHYNGTYYEEIFNTTSDSWEFIQKNGVIYASGDLVKVLNDPVKDDVIHVFFINTTEAEINGTSYDYIMLSIQHFIINATNNQILMAYVLCMYNNTGDGMTYKSFADINVFAYDENVTIIYGMLEYNSTGEFTDVVAYMRMFNVTSFWSSSIEPIWTSQETFFIIGDSERDSRIARDFSCVVYGKDIYLAMFYSYYNSSSATNEYYVYMIQSTPPFQSINVYSLRLKDIKTVGTIVRIIHYVAADWSRLSNGFLVNDSIYFTIMLLRYGREESVYEFHFNTTLLKFSALELLVSRPEIEETVSLPQGSLFGSMKLFIDSNNTKMISLMVFSETERMLLLLSFYETTFNVTVINVRQPSFADLVNSSQDLVQVFYACFIGGLRVIQRVNITNATIHEEEYCANETNIFSMDAEYLPKIFYVAYTATEIVNGEPKLVGKIAYGYYDSDKDGLGDLEEVLLKTNASDPDTDDDKINDGGEVLITGTDPNDSDTDNDQLSDYEEIAIYGTNATDADTDDDQLDDYKEIKIYGTNPLEMDTDHDGLTDYEEVVVYCDHGFNPLKPDQDNDNLTDLDELSFGTLGNTSDTDNDGLSDWQEVARFFTDPTLWDTDGDQLSDYDEIMNKSITKYGVNPLEYDTDGDGLSDYEEIIYNTFANDSDTDNDGLTDGEEINIYNTNATNNDTDNDKLSDYEEVIIYETDALSNDTDEDGLSDFNEVKRYHTNPLLKDTDGDGLSDWDEIFNETVTRYGVNPQFDDTDGDGLNDYEEVQLHLLANDTDTDDDGLDDKEEVKIYGTNASNPDTDNDGLDDYEELVVFKTRADLADTDEDGLKDGEEVYKYGTNPKNIDSDADGLNDSYELQIGLDPLNSDTDNDGLKDGEEIGLGCDPLNPDSDEDGLVDGQEVAIGTDPTNDDTDSDFLNDSMEVSIGTNPKDPDTDRDGLKDGEEIGLGCDPLNPDSDKDGLKDGDEILLQCDPLDNDTDDDSLVDSFEISIGTNPLNPDTDDDELSDGDEIDLGTNPTDSDTDDDGIMDGDEIVLGIDPNNPDTDGDGLSDGVEVNLHTDPLDPDTDDDGLSDGDEIQGNTNPLLSDTDGDLFPDRYDILPATNNFLMIMPAIFLLGVARAWSYGYFRNWRKDIICIGMAQPGGTHLFSLPEEFEKSRNVALYSSALTGIHMLTSEIAGEQRTLVMRGAVSIILIRGAFSQMWVFAKHAYPRLVKNLEKIYSELEKKFSDLLSLPILTGKDLAPIIDFIKKNILV